MSEKPLEPSSRWTSVTPELWGGVECTVNRIGDQFFDQLERSGHASRLSDLDLFARLGITALRFPLLWERTAPHGLEQASWSWADEWLSRLQELSIRPIVGLVHHGSGPPSTSLIDPAFPEKLALFAQAVATRYPWLDAYTPVNEPLTTARFSGLYGHWYPHGQDDATFARIQVNQCRGVMLAMQAIRQVNPAAQLIQTEDLGQIFSTSSLAYQATFENERRWLTFDLLCGRVNPDHPMWHYLTWAGIDEAELDWFLEHSSPPDILGANYYLTSERFLDERLERYPSHLHGDNGQQTYADVEAVRVCETGLVGPYTLLKTLWQRYQQPLALTEVHNGCTREEQMRWFVEMWQATQQLCAEDGADIRAVTAWALLGTYDWNSLLTRREDHYEPGVFDLRGRTPRPTALASLISQLARGRQPDHPVLDTPGWWVRPQRLLYPAVAPSQVLPQKRGVSARSRRTSPRPLLILGQNGTLGSAFVRLCAARGLAHYACARAELDITREAALSQMLDIVKPWAVVNAAGYVRVDSAEAEPEQCYQVNSGGPALLAETCAVRGIQLLTFSSDLVFDGQQASPYVESDDVAPLNVYGQSKAQGEKRVLQAYAAALVVRTSAFFGPWDPHNFVTIALRTLADGRPFTVAEDVSVSPTYVPDLVHACLDLLIDGESGLWHLANEGGQAGRFLLPLFTRPRFMSSHEQSAHRHQGNHQQCP